MSRRRHPPLRAPLALLAILALLWSQFVLASHPAESVFLAASELTNAVAVMEDGCGKAPAPSGDTPICAAHCSVGDQSSEVGRVPAVPALVPSAPTWIASAVRLEASRDPDIELPPPISWHRPTSHPASLLLI